MAIFTIKVPEGPDVPWLEFFDLLERYGLLPCLMKSDISFAGVRNVTQAIEDISSVKIGPIGIKLIWGVVCRIHFSF